MSSILGRKSNRYPMTPLPEIDALVQQALMSGYQPPSVEKPMLPEVDAMVQRALTGKAPMPVPEFSPMASMPEPQLEQPQLPKRSQPAMSTTPKESAISNPAVREFIAKKYGFGEGESQEALARAQESGSNRRLMADLGAAANKIGSSIAGVQTDNSFYDKLAERADSGVKEINERRKGTADDMAFGQAMRENEASQSDDDMNSDATKTYQMLAQKMLPSKDFSQMSAAQIKRVLPSLEKLYDTQQRQLDRQDARDERRAMFGLTQAEKKRTEDEKKKAGMFEIEDRRQNIGSALDSLDRMIDDKGTWETLGSHNQDMDRLVEQIATDMAKLQDPSSIARPSEVEMIKKSLVQSGFQNSNSTAREILKNFRGEVERRADGAYKVRGMEKPAGGQSGSFPRQIRKDGKTATVRNEAELKEAMSEGWQ